MEVVIMKRIVMILAALMLAALPLVSLAENAPTVTVNGAATVSVAADFAKVSLAVETSAAAVADALSENADRMAQVLQALEEAGIPAADIVTDRFHVYTQYDYTGQNNTYNVTNALTVTVRELGDVGRVIDTALSAGANACNGISFYSNTAAQANDDALTAAIAEARRKAELAAAACGKTLGDLVSLTEAYGSYGGVRLAKAADMAAGTAILPDGLDFTANVTATFELK